MSIKILVPLCAAAALMAACNKPHDKDATATPDTQAQPADTAPPPADASATPPPADQSATPPPADQSATPPPAEQPANPPKSGG
jgi:hypothetical protein